MSNKTKPGSFGSDISRLLQAAEAGQKADILDYSSGHLGPRGLTHSQPFNETKPFFWRMSQSQEKAAKHLTIQKRQIKVLPHIKKTKLKESPSEITSGVAFEESRVSGLRESPGADHSSHADTGEDNLSKKTDSKDSLKSSSASEGNQPFCSGHSDLGGLNSEVQPEMRQQLGQQAVTKQNIWAGIKVEMNEKAEMHERKLQKELKKLSAQSWPSRDRLAVFSDVFDDVCEGSPVFGRILREIKTDYDLYVNHMMASQALLDNTSLDASVSDCVSGKVRELELDEAAEEVSRLEQEARLALEEKKRVQNELQNVPAITSPEDSDMRISPSGLQESCCDSIHFRRLQVLKVWKEIQQLEEEIKEKLVSTVITSDTNRQIKQQKTEIMKLIASNDRLRIINKDLENNINAVLNREKASKSLRRMLWDEILCDLQTESKHVQQEETEIIVS